MTPYITVRISESARSYIDRVKALHHITISDQIRELLRRRMMAETSVKDFTKVKHKPTSWHLRPPNVVSVNDEIRQLIESGKVVTAQ